MDRFHISATGHSLNYLPEYIALRRGFFRDQGLDVSASVPRPWDRVLDELADGVALAALGGIWVPSMYRHRVRDYAVFAQVANRAPLALMRRKSDATFELSDTVGRTVLMKGSNGASVGLFFKMLLREHRIDPTSVHYVQDLDGAMLGELFVGGMGDFLLVDHLAARVLEAQNRDRVSVAVEMVTHGGDIPWSVYYSERAAITPAVLDTQKRFCIALNEGIRWVLQHDAETYRDELAELFPAVPVDIVVGLANVYRENGMWTSSVVSRHGHDRWQRGIVNGHLTTAPVAYEDLVTDTAPSATVAT